VITEKRNQIQPFFYQKSDFSLFFFLDFQIFDNNFISATCYRHEFCKLENLRTVSSALHSHAYNKVIKEALTLKGTNDTSAVTSTSFNLKVVLSPSDTSIFDYTELLHIDLETKLFLSQIQSLLSILEIRNNFRKIAFQTKTFAPFSFSRYHSFKH